MGAGVLLWTVGFVLSFTESSALHCFYGNLDNKSSIETCITAEPPPECFSTVRCEDPLQICYTYGNITPSTDTFNYFSGCLQMDECQTLKGSLNDCGIVAFGFALVFNSEHFCSSCCEDPYCNDLDVLRFLIPKPETTTTVITSSLTTTVMTTKQQTTVALDETSRLVATSTKPPTNTQAVEEQESTSTPTTDAASQKLASTGIPDTTMIHDPKTTKKGTATTAETSSSVHTSATPFTTTRAVDESTSGLMKDVTSHELVSTSISLAPDTTRTAKITVESSTLEKTRETMTKLGFHETSESKLTKTSADSFTDLVSTSGAESLHGFSTNWNGHATSTITTATRITSTEILSNLSVQTHSGTYPVESSPDYEKYCNSPKEAVFGVTRRGLHGLNVFFSRLDNTPPCIYGEVQREQPSGNFPVCANACLMSNSCQLLSFNRSKKMCTIFSLPNV